MYRHAGAPDTGESGKAALQRRTCVPTGDGLAQDAAEL